MKALSVILKVFVCVVLIFAIVFCAEFFFWYPHYLKNKSESVIVPAGKDDGSVRIASCNVRCINPLDAGKKSWFYRADLLVKGLAVNTLDIIGFQEVTKWQYKYLQDSFPGFDSVITYRDKAFNSEGCPVFYNTSLFELVDKGSFWLSETPDEMSKDWGAACYRICSYTILKFKQSDKQFVVFNTHLDHVSDEARINGIKVVLDKIKEFGSLPSLIMGDLNADEESETYKTATQYFNDVKYLTDNTASGCTYQNFGNNLEKPNIDYFLISKEGIDVNSYKIITDTYDGVYSSDHFPIITEIVIK